MHELLISDLHLCEDTADVNRAFLQFLREDARRASTLYILGDLFEVWIGDDEPSSFNDAIKAELKAVSDAGTRLYFIRGNRDFMIHKPFALATGCTILPQHSRVQLAGETVLLTHGDTLCTDDREYQRFRRMIRNPLSVWILRHLPLARRQAIARGLREKSKEGNANKAENIMDVNNGAVEKMFTKYRVNTIIHGHTHRPAVHQHSNGKRIVLGDWHHHGWYVTTESGEPELKSFPIKQL